MKSDESLFSLPWAVETARLADYVALAKPRLVFLVLFTAAAGYLMAAPVAVPLVGLVHLLVGTALVAGGGSALNQYLERDRDARMERTADRPLPAMRLAPTEALIFGVGVTAAGLVHLALFTNALTLLLGIATSAIYVLAYTPLKRTTPWCLAVGAVVGALPPVMGCVAVSGHLGIGAALMFALLYLWQLPHFLAIACLYRQDYANAQFAITRLTDETGRRTRRHIPMLCLILVLVALIPTFVGVTGRGYAIAAVALGLGFLAISVWDAGHDLVAYARRVFVASLIYLPALLVAMVLGRV
ncbi:MAG: protoheme IX farnesyltransferase [candidate division Zixibacteria bacterium]|nr:protoheme IX farnesyltransferase [candidate division Zixibacteria bacterium]